MNKITIIGLGLVGNSLGMALKRAATTTTGDQSQPPAMGVRVTGFDPNRQREAAALRYFASVDEIAPDLRRAVEGAELVVLATPAGAAREVLEALVPFLEEGATVTDVLPAKAEVLSWAREAMGPRGNFVGGHPLSKSVDLSTAGEEGVPSADLFLKAPYSIIPMPGASNDSLNRVIWLAEMVGAQPLFVDAVEHDSFMAAATHLPVMVSAALLTITASGPTWGDMQAFAGDDFQSVAEPLTSDPAAAIEGLVQNRDALIRWIDQYQLALQELRDILASGDEAALDKALGRAYQAQTGKTKSEQRERQLRDELNRTIKDASPARSLMGGYLADRFFHRKDKDRQDPPTGPR